MKIDRGYACVERFKHGGKFKIRNIAPNSEIQSYSIMAKQYDSFDLLVFCVEAIRISVTNIVHTYNYLLLI